MTDDTGALWIVGNFFDVAVGFVPDKKAWRKTIKQWAPADAAGMDYPDSDGRCTSFHERDSNRLMVLITIGPAGDKSLTQIAALVAHEATHAFRAICDRIQEHSPSEEFAAYTVQCIVQTILAAYVDSRHGEWNGITPKSKTA